MGKIYFLLLGIFFGVQPLFAFSKLQCHSSLNKMSLWTLADKEVLNSKINRAQLSEKESPKLILKSGKQVVLKVSPWNGVEVLEKNKKFKVDFKSDKESWFSISVSGAKESGARESGAREAASESFECRLTF